MLNYILSSNSLINGFVPIRCSKAGKEEGMGEDLKKCREELNALKEKAKEVDVLKEKMES